MLKKQFKKTSLKYCQDREVIDECWQEIEQAYRGRSYHNITHLDAIYRELKIVKDDIEDWDALFYAICYHDIVYDVQRSDNELQSATLARIKLKNLNLPPKMIERISQQIIATKEHSSSEDSDSDLLIDADLAILGSGDYESYLKGIREEYSCYSDREFYEGRRVVLEYFLMQKQIYKTTYFFDRYEQKARWNLEKEIKNYYI
jgi:predicted metal-dependent HD superfamily phosphohydrolase